MSPVHGARVRGSERAREREAKKIRGRNAGPLAPSSPWLQSLRGKGEGIMAPGLQRRPRPCNVPQACSLHPGTGSETPSPALQSLSVSLSVALGRGSTSQVPQMPAAIFVLLSPCPLPVSFPTATAHGAENVAKLQLGKFRSQSSVASRTNGVGKV